jgi:CheY-like chemotaxis protein
VTTRPPRPLALVVEDDAAVRQILAILFDEAGCDVVEAEDGAAALALLSSGVHPDLISLGLMMPRMNGWELGHILRRSPEFRTIPVVLISANPRIAEAASDLGAVAFLEKPVSLPDFLATVERVVGKQPRPGPTTRRAACSCGQLTADCEGEPVRVSVCHCLACQRRTGSAFGVQARFLRDQVALGGRAARCTRVGDSGSSAEFAFCPDCGTTVWWTLSGMPEFVAIAVGAFADPGFPAPGISIYEDRRHPWLTVAAEEHWH